MNKILCQWIAKRSGKSFASKSEVKELAEFAAEWQSAFTARNVTFTPIAASAEYARHRKKIADCVRRGDTETRALSMAEIESDYRQRSDAALAIMEETAKQAQPLVSKILTRFVDAVEDVIKGVEAAEVKEYAEMGLPYSPTAKLIVLRSLKDQARARIPANGQGQGYASPASHVAFLNLE